MSWIKALVKALAGSPEALKNFVRGLYKQRGRCRPGRLSATTRYAGGCDRKRKKHTQVHEDHFLRRMFRSGKMRSEKKVKFSHALEMHYAGDDTLMEKYRKQRAEKKRKSVIATGPQSKRRRELLKKREERARA